MQAQGYMNNLRDQGYRVIRLHEVGPYTTWSVSKDSESRVIVTLDYEQGNGFELYVPTGRTYSETDAAIAALFD